MSTALPSVGTPVMFFDRTLLAWQEGVLLNYTDDFGVYYASIQRTDGTILHDYYTGDYGRSWMEKPILDRLAAINTSPYG